MKEKKKNSHNTVNGYHISNSIASSIDRAIKLSHNTVNGYHISNVITCEQLRELLSQYRKRLSHFKHENGSEYHLGRKKSQYRKRLSHFKPYKVG